MPTEDTYDDLHWTRYDRLYVNKLLVAGESPAVKSGVMGVVVHNAANSVPRPSGYPSVTWIGSVQPLNMANGDIWYDTSS